MRRFLILITILAAARAGSAQSTFAISGFLTGRAERATGQRSWLEGGFGRLDTGDSKTREFATLQLGLDWAPSRYFDIHAQGLGRLEPSGYKGKRAGVPEAYADLRAFLGNEQFQLRAGAFFLPTSRENKEDLWSSPYTITLSALNTWIAHEVRPVGVDLQWKHGDSVTAAATAFRGNDAMGALLAWRGWALGSRLSVYDEVLPLPPLFSLEDPHLLGGQRSDGTTAFGREFDSHLGYAGRLRFSLPERANIQFTHVDNGGDRELYNGEYSWQTKFNIVGGEVGSTGPMTLAAEYAWGSTGMGRAPNAFVQMGFRTAYVLVSRKTGPVRLSARFDTFRNEERDHSAAESNDEKGHAWTVAALYDLSEKARAGVEYVDVKGSRPAAAESGFDANAGGRSVILELRYHF